MGMTEPLIECVPNFSDGTNPSLLAALQAAISSVSGTLLLGLEADADHNRSVFTFAGPAEAVLESAIRAAGVATEGIDIRQHRGVHPRIGAADVIPFVPLHGAAMEDCVALAGRAAEEIWRRYQVPSYLYEFAARVPEREKLEAIRKVGFEALRVRPDLAPDVGGPGLHPTAGAYAIGARRILIACNVNLATANLAAAKSIAKAIRASSGGFAYVKALGLALPQRELTQVSMNLTNFEVTSLRQVYDRILELSAGVRVHSTEIIGFPPQAALAGAQCFLTLCERWSEKRILENRMAALNSTGSQPHSADLPLK